MGCMCPLFSYLKVSVLGVLGWIGWLSMTLARVFPTF